jgi:hypothetical protein
VQLLHCQYAAAIKSRRILSAKEIIMRILVYCSIFVATFTTSVFAQIHKERLYVDDGSGQFTLIKSNTLGAGGQTVNLPNLGGTTSQFVLMTSPFNGTNEWQLGDLPYASGTGNALTRLATINDPGVNYYLTNNGSGALSWTAAATASVTEVTSSSTDVVSVANVYQNLSSISVTISTSGNYLVFFNGDAETTAGAPKSVSVAFYVNGVQQASSERTIDLSVNNRRSNISTMAYLSLTAADILVTRFTGSGTSVQMEERNMIVQKVN